MMAPKYPMKRKRPSFQQSECSPRIGRRDSNHQGDNPHDARRASPRRQPRAQRRRHIRQQRRKDHAKNYDNQHEESIVVSRF